MAGERRMRSMASIARRIHRSGVARPVGSVAIAERKPVPLRPGHTCVSRRTCAPFGVLVLPWEQPLQTFLVSENSCACLLWKQSSSLHP